MTHDEVILVQHMLSYILFLWNNKINSMIEYL